MKRVLCLIDSLGPGGAQRQLVGLGLFLKERGYDVTVAAYYNNQFYVDQLTSGGVPFVFIQRAQKGLLRQWYLMTYINRYKPDVVISYLESPSIRACVAHLFNRKFKLIVSERNTTQHLGWREKLRFSLFHITDYIVPNSFSQAGFITQSFPSLSDKVVTIPNFVDLQHFVPCLHERRDIPEIVVVATIWASKNTLGLIDAVEQLKKRGHKFHVSWYGRDLSNKLYFNECQRKIDNLKVDDCIELKDKTPHIVEKYQNADFFCLPSFYEGMPNVICEAMACGLPVACSNVCDNSRFVVDGDNGFLFDPFNYLSIANALEKILTLSELEYRSFCRNSRDRAIKMFTIDGFVQSYINLIEK